MEFLGFALVVATCHLKPYFQAHSTRVLTEAPLKKALHRPDMSGRLVNWSIKLSKFNIDYIPQTTIKGQALAKFMSKMVSPLEEVLD